MPEIILEIPCVVEGNLDEAVLTRLTGPAGLKLFPVYGRNGKAYILDTLAGFNNAAKGYPWLVLIDLDQDAACAPEYGRIILPHKAAFMHLIIPVREIESWLLADPESLAGFLGISQARINNNPEQLLDPKEHLIQLAGLSRNNFIKKSIIPRPGSGKSEGRAYTSTLQQYVREHWRPQVARQNSPSLNYCLESLNRIQVLLGGN